MAEIFEIIMVLCFGASWPFNVMKSYKARTTKGKSLLFLCLIFFGYIAGIASKFTNESYMVDVHRDISYFMLNHLPDDFVPAWDYDYTYVNAIKDSSAGVISACGFMEMANRFAIGCS